MLDGRSASPPVREREFTAAATFIAAPDHDCPLGSRITLPDGTRLVLAVAQQTPAPIGTSNSATERVATAAMPVGNGDPEHNQVKLPPVAGRRSRCQSR